MKKRRDYKNINEDRNIHMDHQCIITQTSLNNKKNQIIEIQYSKVSWKDKTFMLKNFFVEVVRGWGVE
jgi:hypothetical protein